MIFFFSKTEHTQQEKKTAALQKELVINDRQEDIKLISKLKENETNLKSMIRKLESKIECNEEKWLQKFNTLNNR
jgi:hypothetical protein